MAGRRTPSQDYEIRRMSMPKIKQAQGEFLYTICNPKTEQLESYYRLMSGHVVYTCFPATAEQVKEAKAELNKVRAQSLYQKMQKRIEEKENSTLTK